MEYWGIGSWGSGEHRQLACAFRQPCRNSLSGERTRPRVLFSAPRRNAFLFNQRESLARRQRQHARRVRSPESFARHAPKREHEQG